MDRHVLFYFVGITILFVINGMLLLHRSGGRYAGFPNPLAVSNLFAGVCIAYYFMHREGYIQV
jgi:hypothetical protein